MLQLLSINFKLIFANDNESENSTRCPKNTDGFLFSIALPKRMIFQFRLIAHKKIN